MYLLNLAIGLTYLLSTPHDYHVGIFNIDINQREIQITQKLFSDDFEKAFYLQGEEIKIGDDLGEEKVSKAMQEYVRKHFKLSVGREELKLDYVGAEWDDDLHTIYLYWEFNQAPHPLTELTIFNNIFMEVSEDQQNMHHVKKDGRQVSVLTERNKTEQRMLFN